MQSSSNFLMTLTRNFAKLKRPSRKSLLNPKPSRRMIKVKDDRPIVLKQRKVNEAHMEAALALGLGWRIVGAT